MKHFIYCTIPGLRQQDLTQMPNLQALVTDGSQQRFTTSFPAVTWPAQASMLTGKLPSEHGVIANGFYWRDKKEVEMWTAWNDKIEAPQIWDLLHEVSPDIKSLAWFPMLSKGSGADYICMPKPVHNPDGSESLWCYTQPQEYYGDLLESIGHFPLKHFWGPLANIKSSQWILESAVKAISDFKPHFSYIYIPHLDYAAQKLGPNSPAALQSVTELDEALGEMIRGIDESLGNDNVVWIISSEYVINEVDHVTYPNRILREAGLLNVSSQEDGEHLDLDSPAWALVDHQFSHLFIKNRCPETIKKVQHVFQDQDGIAEIIVGEERSKYGLDHERSGDVILVSTSNSWQAYYYWLDDTKAPGFARTVDIHRKPGFDPVELHFDMETKSIPLDANLIKGSHGAPVTDDTQQGVIVSNCSAILEDRDWLDTELCDHLVNALSKSHHS